MELKQCRTPNGVCVQRVVLCAFADWPLSMSDLIKVGAHCAVPTCNVLDFLPLTCKCDLVLCRDHIFPDNHACSAVQEPMVEGVGVAPTTTSNPLRRCGLEGCQKPTLYAFTTEPQRETCERCHGSFCVQCVYHDIWNVALS